MAAMSLETSVGLDLGRGGLRNRSFSFFPLEMEISVAGDLMGLWKLPGNFLLLFAT